MADAWYLWSQMYSGGDVEVVVDPIGRERKVVSGRNVLQPGEKVTQADLDASDEQWQEWVDGGVVRNYPFPDDLAAGGDSPLVHLQKKLTEAAQNEEERLSAAVSGATTSEEGLVEAAANLPAQEEPKEAPAPKATEKK